jgi:GTPase SAR1 family protein
MLTQTSALQNTTDYFRSKKSWDQRRNFLIPSPKQPCRVLYAANMNTNTQLPGLKFVSVSKENSEASGELRDLLERFRKLCEESVEGLSESLSRIAELQRRLAEERFHLAVLGQFKRGKSTLLNALLGEPLLPTGVVPLTSIPTFLLSGAARTVRVFFHDGRQAAFADLTREQASDVLARHVTEAQNPRNQLGVERVVVEHPSSLLSAGVVLIDTPGIGSTLRHNTEATLQFLQQCDAALFVVSADPPITEVEKDFLKAVQDKVAKLCFVMNKVDYVSGDELGEAVRFFEMALRESGFHSSGTIFRITEEPLRWRESGLEELQNYLFDFLSREKLRTLQFALASKAVAVVVDAAMNVQLQLRSFQLSQQELQKRIEIFDAKVKEIEQEKIKMADLLAWDRRRTVEFLESLAETLRRDARRHLGEVVTHAVQDNRNPVVTERQARDQVAEEIPVFFAAKRVAFSSAVNHALQEALLPYQRRLDDLISALRFTAAELFDISYCATTTDGSLEELHRPYWVTQKWSTSVSPVPEGFLDRFLPSELRKHRLQKRLDEEVETLITHNVENLRWATLRNLEEAFRRFSSTLDERLKATAETTRWAMRAARQRRTENENMTQPELERLEQKVTELTGLHASFAQFVSTL